MMKPDDLVFELDGLQVYYSPHNLEVYWRTERYINGVGPFRNITEAVEDHKSQRAKDASAKPVGTPHPTAENTIYVNFVSRKRV